MSTRVGIIGTGFIAESHATAMRSVPALELAGVFDLSTAAGEAFARKWGATAYADLGALLADVDAVIVCTPNDTHVGMGEKALAAGCHLLQEKPMALSAADGERLRVAYDDAGLCLLVGHTHRHSDYAKTVRDVVASGRIGQVRSARIAITGGWIWGAWQAWVLDPARSGGHAFHNGVHLYDLARWWLDEPITQVMAHGQRLTSAALEFDDYLVATLMTASGATAVCEISRGEKPKTTSVFEIVVHGSEGTLLRTWSSEGFVSFSEDGAGPRPVAASDPFAAQLRVFADGIAGQDVEPDARDAVHATAVAEAVMRSAVSGRVEEVVA